MLDQSQPLYGGAILDVSSQVSHAATSRAYLWVPGHVQTVLCFLEQCTTAEGRQVQVFAIYKEGACHGS